MLLEVEVYKAHSILICECPKWNHLDYWFRLKHLECSRSKPNIDILSVPYYDSNWSAQLLWPDLAWIIWIFQKHALVIASIKSLFQNKNVCISSPWHDMSPKDNVDDEIEEGLGASPGWSFNLTILQRIT